MTARRLPLALCLAAALTGFTHAALTTDAPPAVQCYEDGSCDNGWCEPGQDCDDTRDAR